MDSKAQGNKEKKRVALSSVIAALFLTGTKITVGLLTGSLGILSEAAHSALDLVAALMTVFAVRASARPADADHPYGHGKFENISALFETLLLLLTCIWIIHEAIQRLFFHSVAVEANVWSFAVILFSILVVVQFIVVTKGAARISEVAARFTLDAMPGKQMAIDADLNAGLVTEEQARKRRQEVGLEADFYGAMDGASKFLRGDAVSSVVITLVNILGGIYVGMMEYGWSWEQTVGVFTRLTIGDGLVTQIPAFVISVAAALLVTRSTARTNLGEQMVGQIASRPTVLAIAAAFLGVLMLTKLPKIPLLLLGGGMAGLAYWLWSRRKLQAATQPPGPAAAPSAPQDLQKLLAIDPMRIDLGYALVRLVDSTRQGDLMERITSLRTKIAEEVGLLVPPVRIRDDMRLDAHGYAIFIRGSKIASGRIYPNQLLAVGEDDAVGKLLGRQTTEPVFGMPATWISPAQQARAQAMNYTVIDPCGVLTAHLRETILSHAEELLTREQMGRLLDNLRQRCPQLVQEVADKVKPLVIQKVLQNLLRERVAIRDLETILESLLAAAEHSDQPDTLTEQVRWSMARALSQQYCADDGRLWCVSLEPSLEEAVSRYIAQSPEGRTSAIPPQVNQKIVHAVAEGLAGLQKQGRQPVVLCAPGVRAAVRQLLAPVMPRAAVLAYNEIESVQVQSVASIGAEL